MADLLVGHILGPLGVLRSIALNFLLPGGPEFVFADLVLKIDLKVAHRLGSLNGYIRETNNIELRISQA
jgi:hypothetical protein